MRMAAAAAAAVLGAGAIAGCGAHHDAVPAPTTPSSSHSAAASSTDAPASASCPSGEAVTNAKQLQSALSAARPGTSIVLSPGQYVGNFTLTVAGTQAAPVVLCGPSTAVLDGHTTGSGYVLHLDHATWTTVEGLSVTDGQKGVVVDHGSHDTVADLTVYAIGDEGVHLREFTTDSTVRGNHISMTGLLDQKYGEGVYIGTANKNWCEYTGCQPDASNDDVVEGNTISDTTAENIDIKEGTTGGLIEGNSLSGDGLTPAGATAWVNVKGNSWRVIDNHGQTSPKDGFQVHQVLSGWGEDDSFSGNSAVVDGKGYGYYVQSKRLDAVVDCNNTESGAAKGLTNAVCVQS